MKSVALKNDIERFNILSYMIWQVSIHHLVHNLSFHEGGHIVLFASAPSG